MMRVLITGGAGFIGSHLAETLIEDGHRVTVLDDLSTGRLENVNALQDRDAFRMVVKSVLDERAVAEWVEWSDRVYHLAAAVGVQYIIDHPLEAMRVNVDGTENVLQSANQDKTPVLLASTSEIYGKNEQVPFDEDQDRVLGSTHITRWSYSCSKALDEFMGRAYWRQKQLPVVIARFFNVVGPRQTGRYGMVIPRFVNQALLDRPLTVYGDGRQTRVFLDVVDAVRAIRFLMEEESTAGEAYNIGGSERISILDLAERIQDRVEGSCSIKKIPYQEAYEEGFEDMRHRVPNTDKIKNAVGFEPELDLDQILDRIIDYFRSNEGFH